MPSRIIRDWSDSDRFDGLSPEAERLFVRLITKADDFGRFHAEARRLCAACFPLLRSLRESDLSRWLEELAARDLVLLYENGGRKLLAIPRFGQRLKTDKSGHVVVKPKFPAPAGKVETWLPEEDPSTSGKCREVPGSAGQIPASSYSYSDANTESDSETTCEPAAPGVVSDEPEIVTEVRHFIRDHKFVTYDKSTEQKCIHLVRAVGWEKARQLIDEGVSLGKPFPVGWALGKAQNASVEAGATGKETQAERVARLCREIP